MHNIIGSGLDDHNNIYDRCSFNLGFNLLTFEYRRIRLTIRPGATTRLGKPKSINPMLNLVNFVSASVFDYILIIRILETLGINMSNLTCTLTEICSEKIGLLNINVLRNVVV